MNKLLRVVCVLIFSSVCSLCHADNSVIFQLVTDVSQLKAGDQILIANTEAQVVMSSARKLNYGYKSIGVVDKISGEYLFYFTNNMALITLEGSSADYWYLKMGTNGYLYVGSSYYFNTTTTKDDANATISIDDKTCNATITFQNKSSNNTLFVDTGGSEFRCKTLASMNPVQIYKKVGFGVFDAPVAQPLNSENIKNYANQTCTVKVNRTLKADGGWYTLCLPFALTVDDITNQFVGADFEEFSSLSQNGDNVNLTFKSVKETVAGVPYLVKPKNTVENLMFINKTISVSEPGKVTQNINGKDYSFVGTFDPTTLPVDGTARFIDSTGVELVAPTPPTPSTPTSDDGALNGLRAYFLFPSSGAQAKVCHGEIPTSIYLEKVDGQDSVHRIFNLNGQYVGNDQSRLQKGIYVVNGKKVVIK